MARQVRLLLTLEEIVDIQSFDVWRKQLNPLPTNCNVVSASYNPERGTVELILEHPSFAEVEEEAKLPTWSNRVEVAHDEPTGSRQVPKIVFISQKNDRWYWEDGLWVTDVTKREKR